MAACDSLRPAPVVYHVVTDRDMGVYTDKCDKIDLCKVIKLLTDPHSACLTERHIHALRKIAKHHAEGFIMKDLVAVFKILNVCADRVSSDGGAAYVEPMGRLLALCSLPYLAERCSDEQAYEQIAIESTEQLGYLLRVPNTTLQRQICASLRSFYCQPAGPTQLKGNYRASSLTYNQRLVEQSDVAETLVKSLDFFEEDPEMRVVVLDLLHIMSNHSARNCDRMLSTCAAHRLCSRLTDPDPSGRLLGRTIDVLWNLLELGDRDVLATQLCDVTCIEAVRSVFVESIEQGFSMADKQRRNDLLVLATLICSVVPSAPFTQTGFTKQLSVLASFQEVKSHSALVKHLRLIGDHEDFELKKLLINLVVLLSEEPTCLPVLSEGHVLLALFTYVRAPGEAPSPAAPACPPWSPAQEEEITLHALAALATIAPRLLDDYRACQGSTRILLFLDWCTGPEPYSGSGNGFHAALSGGAPGSKRAHLQRCVRLVRALVSTNDDCVLTDLAEQGAVSQLIGVLEMFEARRRWLAERVEGRDIHPVMAVDDAVDVDIQTDLLVTLALLCQADQHKKELFGSEGIDMLVKYLSMDTTLLSSGLGHYCLLLAAISCTWSAVIGCYLTEDYFLEKEGVFLLLDLLERCPTSLHPQLLGALLDLTENPKAVPHIAVWRGAQDRTAARLLCELWRAEERHLGAPRTPCGAIADVCRPLMGTQQAGEPLTPLPSSSPSPAIVDVSENVRAKIYALLARMGLSDLPGLTAEDHVTLTIVEHYLDFKAGEVWTELMGELSLEGVCPTPPDQEALDTIGSVVLARVQQALSVQEQLLEAEQQHQLSIEHQYYAQIRENHRQSEKLTRVKAEFLERTSKHMVLKAAKERQELAIDASRVHVNASTAMAHRTNIPNLNVTTFCGRHVKVESIQADLIGGQLTNCGQDTRASSSASDDSQ